MSCLHFRICVNMNMFLTIMHVTYKFVIGNVAARPLFWLAYECPIAHSSHLGFTEGRARIDATSWCPIIDHRLCRGTKGWGIGVLLTLSIGIYTQWLCVQYHITDRSLKMGLTFDQPPCKYNQTIQFFFQFLRNSLIIIRSYCYQKQDEIN